MRVFNQNGNATDVQIENGTHFLMFDVRKAAGYDNLPAFFGDLNPLSSDNIKLLYNSRSSGQKAIIPALPVLPLAIAGTMGPQHIKVYLNGAGKIVRVVFPIMVGAGGALKLDNSSYLSISTNFSGLGTIEPTVQDDGLAVQIYAVDTVKSSLAFMYEVSHLNASAQKAVDLTNCNQLILPKQITDFQLLARDNDYSVNWSESEMEAVARAQNDLLAVFGTELTANRVIQGLNVSVNLGFEASKLASGGTYYDALGVSDFMTAKITSKYEDRAYLLRVVDTAAL